MAAANEDPTFETPIRTAPLVASSAHSGVADAIGARQTCACGNVLNHQARLDRRARSNDEARS